MRDFTPNERSDFITAVNTLRERGLGAAVDLIGHAYVFVGQDAAGSHTNVHGTVRRLVGINKAAFSSRIKIYKTVPEQIAFYLAHETGHALDYSGPNPYEVVFSNHPEFAIERKGNTWVPHGEVAKEMFEAANAMVNPLTKFLKKPPLTVRLERLRRRRRNCLLTPSLFFIISLLGCGSFYRKRIAIFWRMFMANKTPLPPIPPELLSANMTLRTDQERLELLLRSKNPEVRWEAEMLKEEQEELSAEELEEEVARLWCREKLIEYIPDKDQPQLGDCCEEM
jgi:hypothetical protein